MTPEEAKADIARLKGKTLDKVLTNALRRTARRVKADAIKDIGSRGIGRRIWGKKPSGLKKLLKVERVRFDGAKLTVDLVSKGIPAMIESGGRTAAHDIKAQRRGPKGKRLLSFRAAGGAGAVPEVRHPGSNIPQRPWISPAITKNEAQGAREIEAALNVFAGAV